jgi:hypothetical protein
MTNHPSLLANPNDPESVQEIRAFALLLARSTNWNTSAP